MAKAAGSSGWLLLLGLCVAATLKLSCQGEGGPGDPAVADALSSLLADVGPQVVQPAIALNQAAALGLEEAVDDWLDAELSGGGGDEARSAAQDAWWDAMESWQELEVLQMGPLGSSLTAVGGEDLRDEVYSWPTVNRCRVDQETAYEDWDAADFFTANLVNVYGLAALEVLLYSDPGVNDCSSQVDINSDGSWGALGEAGVQQNRAAYALALVAHHRAVLDTIAVAWDEDGLDWGEQLMTGGEPGSAYASPEQALQAVSDALYYMEIGVQDRKLGYALGVGACEQTSCIEDIESPLAGGSHAWVAVNLRAFRTLYMGGEGAGVDDLLASLGEDALAAELAGALDAADAAASALDLPFDAADAEDVQALYDAVKVVADLWSEQVIMVLSLQIPDEAAGDAD
jgi:uncharacterized protein